MIMISVLILLVICSLSGPVSSDEMECVLESYAYRNEYLFDSSITHKSVYALYSAFLTNEAAIQWHLIQVVDSMDTYLLQNRHTKKLLCVSADNVKDKDKCEKNILVTRRYDNDNKNQNQNQNVKCRWRFVRVNSDEDASHTFLIWSEFVHAYVYASTRKENKNLAPFNRELYMCPMPKDALALQVHSSQVRDSLKVDSLKWLVRCR